MADTPQGAAEGVAGFSTRFVVMLVCVALFAGSAALYAPSLGFGFVGYDDSTVLLGHPNLYGQAAPWASLREIFVGYFPREEPLLVRDLSWLLDGWVFGFGNPVGYHLGNVLLNATNVVLVFLLVLYTSRAVAFSALTAALFAALAVHVEPVCWVMGRKDLLGAFFGLLALLAQTAQLRSPRGGRRALLYAAVLTLYPVAVLAKFSSIVLILVLVAHRLLWPYLDGQRLPAQRFETAQWPRILVGYAPHLALGIALQTWYRGILTAYQIVGGFGPPPLSTTHLGTLAELVPLSLQGSLGRILWPAHQSIAYLRPNVAVATTTGELVSGLCVLTALVALTVVLVRYRKDLALLPIAFVLLMLPYFNVEYIGIWAADRYSYLASLPVVALVAAPLARGLRHARYRRAALVGLALVATLAAHQASSGRGHQYAFRDGEALWTYERELPQPSILAHASYARVMLAKAEAAEAGSPRRQQWLQAAVDAAKRGMVYHRGIPWRPAPGYVARDTIQLAGMLTVLAQAARLADAPLEQQLALRRAAFDVAAADQQTEDLARILWELAVREPRDLAKARESLHHFRDHVRFAARDPLLRPKLRAQLGGYADAFPELASEVRSIEAESLR